MMGDQVWTLIESQLHSSRVWLHSCLVDSMCQVMVKPPPPSLLETESSEGALFTLSYSITMLFSGTNKPLYPENSLWSIPTLFRSHFLLGLCNNKKSNLTETAVGFKALIFATNNFLGPF